MTGGCASHLRHSLKGKRASVGKAEPFRTVRLSRRGRRLSSTTSNQTQSGAETSFNAPLHERVWKDTLPFRWGHSINHCGFAAAQCGKALPYRQISKITGGYASQLRRTRYFASLRLALKTDSHSVSPPGYLSSRAL